MYLPARILLSAIIENMTRKAEISKNKLKSIDVLLYAIAKSLALILLIIKWNQTAFALWDMANMFYHPCYL